jgi:hypothetical protein
MTYKVVTYASKQLADDQKAAVFKRYRSDQLGLRGATELDCYRSTGKPIPIQVTTLYVDAPPPSFADPANPTAKELSDYAASKQVQMAVDATVDAMQGANVDVGGKQVTIDVSSAVQAATIAVAAKG